MSYVPRIIHRYMMFCRLGTKAVLCKIYEDQYGEKYAYYNRAYYKFDNRGIITNLVVSTGRLTYKP